MSISSLNELKIIISSNINTVQLAQKVLTNNIFFFRKYSYKFTAEIVYKETLIIPNKDEILMNLE